MANAYVDLSAMAASAAKDLDAQVRSKLAAFASKLLTEMETKSYLLLTGMEETDLKVVEAEHRIKNAIADLHNLFQSTPVAQSAPSSASAPAATSQASQAVASVNSTTKES